MSANSADLFVTAFSMGPPLFMLPVLESCLDQVKTGEKSGSSLTNGHTHMVYILSTHPCKVGGEEWAEELSIFLPMLRETIHKQVARKADPYIDFWEPEIAS